MNLEDLNNSELLKDDAPEQKSGRQLLAEIGHLFLKLLWAILRKTLRVTAKGILAIIAGTTALCEAISAWWHDKSTQEKVRFLRIKLRVFARNTCAFIQIMSKQAARLAVKGCKLFAKYSIIALIASWKGIIWLSVNTVHGIIHLRSTLVRLWHWTKTSIAKIGPLCRNIRRASRLRSIRRKRSWQNFQRRGGVKGAMQRTASTLNNSVQMFMEEEQNEAMPDAVTEDDIFAEEIEQNEQASKAQIIGKKFFNEMKKVVDADEKK